MRRRFSIQEAKRIGARLGIRWRKFSPVDFRTGMNVELEHGARDPRTDVTHDDPMTTGRIAWTHLLERPDYYRMLRNVETQENSRSTMAAMKRRRRSTKRRRASSRANPGHRYLPGGVVVFKDSGRKYRVGRATRHQAARYLAHDVKIAEHKRRSIPKGPSKISPSAAGVVLRIGNRRKRRAGSKACVCPPKHRKTKRHVTRRATAPKRRKKTISRPRKAAATTRRQKSHMDTWDYIQSHGV